MSYDTLRCQKLYLLCNFLLMSAKTSKAVIAVCVYASESFRFALLETGICYYAMT